MVSDQFYFEEIIKVRCEIGSQQYNALLQKVHSAE